MLDRTPLRLPQSWSSSFDEACDQLGPKARTAWFRFALSRFQSLPTMERHEAMLEGLSESDVRPLVRVSNLSLRPIDHQALEDVIGYHQQHQGHRLSKQQVIRCIILFGIRNL